MTTPTVPTVTDELIAELEAAANAATPQNLDSAEDTIKADPGAMIECPVCGGEGYASIENDYCNFDNHAIGVQFYGIGPEFGAGERYFRAASPATILALLAERADLTRQLAAASITAENYETFRRNAERYLFLRNLHYDLMGSAGIPCAAIPSSSMSGVYANGYDLDAAIDAARDIAGMDIGSGD